MNPSPDAKAQHYIPKFYLKGFMDEKKQLWVLEKRKAPRASRPKEEAHRPDFYTFTDRGSRDESAEQALCLAENTVAPIIRKLANRNTDLTQEEISALYVFVAFMFARVPCWRTMLDEKVAELMRKKTIERAKDKERFHADFATFVKPHSDSESVEAEKLRQFILSDKWIVEQKSVGYNLRMMFDSAFAIMEMLAPRGLEILVIPANQKAAAPEEAVFLTSDSPVFTLAQDNPKVATIGVGFGWSNAQVFMPLNKRVCLKISESRIQQKRGFASPKLVKQINRVLMGTATQYVYSSRGERRLARLFDEFGCKVILGKNAFITSDAVTLG